MEGKGLAIYMWYRDQETLETILRMHPGPAHDIEKFETSRTFMDRTRPRSASMRLVTGSNIHAFPQKKHGLQLTAARPRLDECMGILVSAQHLKCKDLVDTVSL